MSGLENSASILPDYIDAKGLRAELAMKVQTFENAANQLTDAAAILVAQGNAGASTNVTASKSSMETVINWLDYQIEELKRVLERASDDSGDFSQVFNAKKREVEALRKKVEDAREIDRIRQEQVKSLELREEANYHSSWMGLARPLKEESRTGLGVAAGAFSIVAIISAYYILKMRQEIPDSGFFRGGHRKGRYSQ